MLRVTAVALGVPLLLVIVFLMVVAAGGCNHLLPPLPMAD